MTRPAQIEPEYHEDFVAEILRACDRAGVELAGCMCDEFIVAKNWMQTTPSAQSAEMRPLMGWADPTT